MLIGTSWCSKTSSNSPRISTRLPWKKRIPSGQFISSKIPGPCNDSTTKRPLWANLASASRGSKSYASALFWGQEQSRKKQATPIKPAGILKKWLCNPAKTNNPLLIKTTKHLHLWGVKSTLAEMQSYDRATSMKITVVTTSMKLTLPSQIPSPTIDAVM